MYLLPPLVPDYLRTKLDLSLEQYNQAITEKATSSAESSEEIQVGFCCG